MTQEESITIHAGYFKSGLADIENAIRTIRNELLAFDNNPDGRCHSIARLRRHVEGIRQITDEQLMELDGLSKMCK